MKIILDCERMKYANSGLYYFCLNLGLDLKKQAVTNNDLLYFYTPEKCLGVFGNDANYLTQHSLQKFYLPYLNKANIWHSTNQETYYYPNPKKIKIVLTIHDINFMHVGFKAQFKIDRELKKLQKKIDKANEIVVISNFVKQDIEKNFNLGNKKISVIYNGCNVPDNPEFSRPSFLTDDKPFLFSIGTICRKKNFHVLPALLHGNDYKLVVAGVNQDDNYYQEIIGEAKKYNVQDRLILPGSVTENEKWWLYKNMDAFLFTSLSEGFGLPVIEAMYFGKPVILSTHTSLPEIGGDVAYYFENFDPVYMQNILKQSLLHFGSNKELPGIIKQHALKFNWEKAAEQYFEIYRKVSGC